LRIFFPQRWHTVSALRLSTAPLAVISVPSTRTAGISNGIVPWALGMFTFLSFYLTPRSGGYHANSQRTQIQSLYKDFRMSLPLDILEN
jgi:hypothetical protein